MGYHDLSEREQQDFMRYSKGLSQLAEGMRVPVTLKQEHFLAVLRGEAQASTYWELLYLKHRKESPVLPGTPGNLMPDDEELVPTDAWGSREDWKKMRKRYRG